MLWRRARDGHDPGAALTAVRSLRLEPARSADAPRLAALSRQLIETGLPWRWRAPDIARLIAAEDDCVVVARGDEGIVGFAAMSFSFARGRAHLLLLAVVPERRGEGLAARLVDWLETLARRGGIAEVELEVRLRARAARALYARLGYAEKARLPGYYAGREDALRLRKRFRRRE